MKFAINCLLTEKLLRVKWKPAPVQLLETSVQTLIRSWWLQLLHHYSTLVQWLERYIVTVEITSSISYALQKYNHAANYCMEKDKNKSIVKSTDNPFAYKVDCSTNRETGSN